MTIIISDYSSYYEEIHTEEHLCILTAKLKYTFKSGYRVWNLPTLWISRLWFRITGKRSYVGSNISFKRYIKGSDQVTYWQPWMNVN